MLLDFPYTILLASNSPRRQELLADLDIEFSTFVKKDIDESFPSDMDAQEVASFLSKKKADAYRKDIKDGLLIITADTVVIQGGKILGKPEDKVEAYEMIKALSGKSHTVITGVSLTTKTKQNTFSANTEVTFATLTDQEINYYINKYKPYDKAGAYGIQEWIGYIGVQHISGSYFNVMGLPVQQLYTELKAMAQ
ncbi:MAG: Maf-like protein [Bacteroidales bacterium]|jgi:septum formation protein|nr:Maf-like protein [Bacteroidales bacterium]